MNKKLALVLALVLVVSLVAFGCQKQTTTTEPAQSQDASTPAPAQSSEPVPAPAPEVKGATGDINFYTRDKSSGTREAFEKGIGMGKEDQITAKAVEVSGNGDMATKIGNDPQGFGYVSLTTDFAANKIRPVKYEGVEATVAAVLDGSYKLQRPFSYVTREKGTYASPEAEALVNAFVVFITQSEEGMTAVEGAHGIVDMSKAKPWKELVGTIEGFDPDKDYSGVTIRTCGSTSVEKTLKAALEAFQAEVKFEFKMDQTGSGDGYKRVLGEEKDGANAGDIGFASRPFDPEKEDVTKGMASGAYCLDAVVVAVQQDNPIENLTADVIKDIVLGKITSWENVK
ncbi:substrate-binding domain-containing protein [Guggenheimella bovis]